MVTVVLHDLKYLNLVSAQASSIAVDEIPEEIHEFALIVALFRLILDVLANDLDELEYRDLLIEHGLVVVVHFLQEVDAADVLLDVVDHLWNVPHHPALYLVEVLNQSHDVVVTHVQQLQTQLTLGDLGAAENKVQHFRVQV